MEAKSYFSVHSPMLRKQVTICFLPKQIFKMFCLVAERISYNFMNCGLRESCLLLRHYWRESYPQGTNPSAFAACWQVFNSSFKISVLKMTCRWNDPVTKDPTEYQSALCCVFRNDFANVQIRSFLLAPKFEVKTSSERSKIVSFVFDIASKRRMGALPSDDLPLFIGRDIVYPLIPLISQSIRSTGPPHPFKSPPLIENMFLIIRHADITVFRGAYKELNLAFSTHVVYKNVTLALPRPMEEVTCEYLVGEKSKS